MKQLIEAINRHFEMGFVIYLWVNSCALATLVGRPYLGAIGLGTVVPVLLLYLRRVRRGEA